MINFDAVDFSKRRSEEVINFMLTLSMHILSRGVMSQNLTFFVVKGKASSSI